MKLISIFYISLSLIYLFPISALSQTSNPPSLGEENQSALLISYSSSQEEQNSQRTPEREKRFQDPQAPRFQLMDKNGNFSLGIGGRVRTALDYDFKGTVNSVDFYPSLISTPKYGNYARNQFQIDASASSIYLKLLGQTNDLGDFVVYVNGYFRGSSNTFKLHNAYVSFMGLTIGWDYGLFTDAAGSPPTIDFEGPAGQVLYRNSLLNYIYKHDKWSIGIGVEMPEVDATVTDSVAVNTQRMPNFPAFIQYKWNSNSHFRIAGIIRNMTYSSNTNRKAYSVTGWGVQGSTVFTIPKGWKSFGQITYGKGIGHFFNDLSTLDIDLVPHPEKIGRMQVLPMLGWYAGLQYNILTNLFVSGTYSQSRVYTENEFPFTDKKAYRYGQYLVGNIFWNINSNILSGMEYLHGWKTGFDHSRQGANRLSLLVQYSF